jgi:predicted Rossmann fold flavoprotein
MLLAEMRQAGAVLRLNMAVQYVGKSDGGFTLQLSSGDIVTCESLVVATGGKSIPKMGATDFGYRLAEQFGIAVTQTRPALVPLTFDGELLEQAKALSGVSLPARVACGKPMFEEALLFTHRGLSGPAILQISSYWREGEAIVINLLPDIDLLAALREARQYSGKQSAHNSWLLYCPAGWPGTSLTRLIMPARWAAYRMKSCVSWRGR